MEHQQLTRLLKSFIGLLAALALFAAVPAEAATTWNDVIHGGIGGSDIGLVIAKSAPGTSITGSTSETVLANIRIPANTLASNGRIIIRTFWQFTGTAGTKTRKIYLNTAATAGGTTYMSVAGGSTDLGAQYYTVIQEAGATNSQIGGVITGLSGAASTSALPTSSIDDTADMYVVITATLGSAADTATLAAYSVEIIK